MAQAQDDDIDYDEVSYVISSGPREATMEQLHIQPSTPTEIADSCRHEVAHVSRALQELREKDLVYLLVSEDRKKGRLYDLTSNGEPVGEIIAGRE